MNIGNAVIFGYGIGLIICSIIEGIGLAFIEDSSHLRRYARVCICVIAIAGTIFTLWSIFGGVLNEI